MHGIPACSRKSALLAVASSAGRLGIEYGTNSLPLLGLIAALMVFGTVWSLLFRRGPVEWLMGRATKPAEYVRSTSDPLCGQGCLTRH